uniref:Retrovirus-related Pol polyprotein from transposon TNT 1-94 n=1 Tax=Tanacetum cinerariifolium TaxID=118510 RepID=A0A6L2NK56_TANCI|nr:retrovirus-related Pol polyprotein from transposon TNT 1-94 [Tanacetum cinerariifolium]
MEVTDTFVFLTLGVRYQANPKESHLVAVKIIFRYLKGTPNLGLWYPKGSGFDLKAYSDSNYTGCNLDRKSTSGGCQILGGKLVCRSAKKQTSVAMSSAEAEYVAATGCCAQILWIKCQLADYDVLYDKVPILCDNTSVIAISNNPVLHSRTKHINIRYHFIIDHILKGDVELYFVPTDLQLGDIFTKPLSEPSFTRLVAELGMLNIENRVILSKKQVAETQHVEVTVATANANKSLDAFELEEEQGNQTLTADTKKNASAERLSLPDHLDHICEEVRSLHLKLRTMESYIIHQVSNGIQSTSPALVSTALKEQLLGLLLDTLKSLLKSAMIVADTAKWEKNKKAKDPNLAATQREPQLAEPLFEKHLLKPKEQQKSIQEFTDQLFKTTFLRFSPTPPRELTHLRDSSKGKAYAIIEEPQNELSLRAKFQWVINQSNRLGLPPPPELATFGLSAEEKKRKRTELIKEVFVTKNVSVDGMDKNLITPPRIMPIQGLVINEPESGIFFMNGNTDIEIRLSVEEPLRAGLRGEERPTECKALAGSEMTL